MKKIKPTNPRLLAVAPSSRGFGFAVLEGKDTLVNWGGREGSGDKNRGTLVKVDKLIVQYQPRVLVLEDDSAKDSRRAPRIRKLTASLVTLARRRKVRVKVFSRKTIKSLFLVDGKGTGHDIARVVAERFPEEIGVYLPPKRRAWDNETRRMDYFKAVALVLAHRLWEAKRTAYRRFPTASSE
jgi:hypothetical protein